jgi:hypothetical protein
VGMATAAAYFRLEPGRKREIEVVTPMRPEARPAPRGPVRVAPAAKAWGDALKDAATLRVPDEKFRFLYESALRTLVLHSPGEVYPGPYTYKRFWFRDAAFILEALCCAGLHARAEPCLAAFFPRQRRDGYFLSQEGEWDSNGEALWSLERFCSLSGRPPKPSWRRAVEKRRGLDLVQAPEAGPVRGAPPGGLQRRTPGA